IGTPVRILLSRHGETVFNVEGRWQGQADSALTERGLAQARQLALALRADPVEAVYSSDLGRSMDTAREVAALHGLAPIPEPRLREIDVGTWAGLTRAQIDERYPGMRDLWATRPWTLRLPRAAETLTEAQDRGAAFFAERMPAHLGQTVVVITHGAIGQAILVHAMGGSVEDLWLKERLDNCQISRLEWSVQGGLQLLELCDVRHLVDVGSLGNWRTTDSDFDEEGVA
ncbi:MAG TPA: histidine phosphatase family protein, partial [Chloroflexota bacterium]|nr:histidine phosphatase family protein [Chloroflexota bacterium]